MTLTTDLPGEQTLVLKAKAKAQGVSTEQHARQVIEQDLVPDWLRESWESGAQCPARKPATTRFMIRGGSQHQRQSSRRCHSPLVPRPPSSAQCKATVGMPSLAAFGNLPPASGVRLILDVAKR